MARRQKAEQRLVERSRALRAEPNNAEHRLWSRLRDRRLTGLKFRRQYAIGNFIADFVCPEIGLIVEVDGGQHAMQRSQDDARTRRLNDLGYRVIRFWANEVLSRTDDVVREILKEIENPSPGAGRRPLPASGAR